MNPITHPRWTARTSTDEATYPDLDLVPAGAILWIVSAGRVLLAVFGHETFGAETTLAFLAVVFLPVLLLAPLRWFRLSRPRGPDLTAAGDDTNIAPVVKLAARERAHGATNVSSGLT